MSKEVFALRNLFIRYSHINWALADQAMVSGINFLTGIFIARSLGLEEFGRFTLIWMIVLFLNALHNAAIISPMMSIGPKKDNEKAPYYYGSVFLQQIFWSGISSILLLLGVWVIHYVFPNWHAQPIALPLVSALLAFQIQEFIRRYFYANDLAQLSFLNDTVSYLGQLLLLLVLPQFTSLNAQKVLLIITFTSAIAAGIGLISINTLRFSEKSFFKVTNHHWHFSKWIFGSAVLQWTSGQFFFVAAGYLLGAASVGAIKAAQNIIGVLHVLFQAMENFVPSQAARSYIKGNIAGLLYYLKRVTLWGGMVTVCITLLCGFFAEFWMSLIFGYEYESCAYILRWFSFIYIFSFLAYPLSVGLRTLERTKTLFMALAWISAFTIFCAFPIISFFGLNGVMMGLLVVKICMLIFLAKDFRYQAQLCK